MQKTFASNSPYSAENMERAALSRNLFETARPPSVLNDHHTGRPFTLLGIDVPSIMNCRSLLQGGVSADIAKQVSDIPGKLIDAVKSSKGSVEGDSKATKREEHNRCLEH
jgi:hypothetical protein